MVILWLKFQRNFFLKGPIHYSKSQHWFTQVKEISSVIFEKATLYLDGLAQDCSNSSALAMELRYCSLALCHQSDQHKSIWNHLSGTLTLNVPGPSYLGLTRSISWLLMPWLLASPGHQQPWCWLCRIGRFLSYLRKDFNYLPHINVEKWHKM